MTTVLSNDRAVDDVRADDVRASLVDGGFAIIETSTFVGAVGFLILAGEHATTAALARMIHWTDGYICTAVSGAVLDRLDLPPMLEVGESADGEIYSVSVDAVAGVTTGISAADRATTIRALADVRTTADDLSRPGHVLPVRSTRAGDPAAHGIGDTAVRTAHDCGLRPVVAFAAILDGRGEVAGHDELVAMGDLHGIPIVSAAAMAERTLRRDGRGPECDAISLETPRGRFDVYEYDSAVDGVGRLGFTRARIDASHVGSTMKPANPSVSREPAVQAAPVVGPAELRTNDRSAPMVTSRMASHRRDVRGRGDA